MAWSRVEKLNDSHDTNCFECGLESVDNWLRTRAYANRQNVGTHMCICDPDEIVAFYALKTIIVATENFNSAQRSGSMDGQATGILLCQMGVSVSRQNGGLGKLLLKEAMQAAVAVHQTSPVQLFIVDAENEKLVTFYEKAGLKQLPGTLRLIAPMKTVVKSLN